MLNTIVTQTHLCRYGSRIRNGGMPVLCDRSEPSARTGALPDSPDGLRPFGLAEGKLRLPEGLNQPDAEIEAWFDRGNG